MSYKTSTDYEKLWELACAGDGIVCFVYYDLIIPDKNKYWGAAYKTHKTDCHVSISPFVLAKLDDKKGFIAQCQQGNIEFIDPASQAEHEQLTAKIAELESILKCLKCCRNCKHFERIDCGFGHCESKQATLSRSSKVTFPRCVCEYWQVIE